MMAGKNNKKTPTPANQAQEEYGETDLPSRVDVEKTVLGSVLIEPDHFHEISAALVRADFFSDSNRMIFAAMTELMALQTPIDIIALVERLRVNGQLETVGDVGYISSLVDGVPDRPNLATYLSILKEASQRRFLYYLGRRVIAQAINYADPLSFTVSGTQNELLEMAGAAQQKTIVHVSEITQGVLDNIRELANGSPNQTIGLPFNLAGVDEITTGMREGHMIVLGGFPKSGKTAFAIDTARKLVKYQGVPVGIFSREMRKEELLERIFCQESEVSYAKIRKPTNLSSSELLHLHSTKAIVDQWPLYIDDNFHTVVELVPRAHLMIRKHKVKLLVVDYLQIIGGIGGLGEKPYERVTYVINMLTALAKDTGVPVLCLSQLTRPDEKKGGANVIPTMHMLRESGQIEQNANVILFTYHPMDEQTGDPSGEDLIIIGAQRAGATGREKVWFNVHLQRFEERGHANQSGPVQQSFTSTTSGDDSF